MIWLRKVGIVCLVAVVATGGSLTGSDVTNDEIIAFALPKVWAYFQSA